MQTKLTLRLNQELIRRAKAFAKTRGESVSQVVADFFASLEEPAPRKEQEEFTPIVRSLKGVLRGADVAIEDHSRHLEERYL